MSNINIIPKTPQLNQNKVYWKQNFVLASGLFIYYVINVYVPRVRANAYHVLTTPPRVFRDPKMCLRNLWTAPYYRHEWYCNWVWQQRTVHFWLVTGGSSFTITPCYSSSLLTRNCKLVTQKTVQDWGELSPSGGDSQQWSRVVFLVSVNSRHLLSKHCQRARGWWPSSWSSLSLRWWW